MGGRAQVLTVFADLLDPSVITILRPHRSAQNNSWSYGATIGYALFWTVIASYLNYRMWVEGRLGLVFSWRGKTYKLWESRRRQEHQQLCAARAAARARLVDAGTGAEVGNAYLLPSSSVGEHSSSAMGKTASVDAKSGSPREVAAPVLTKI